MKCKTNLVKFKYFVHLLFLIISFIGFAEAQPLIKDVEMSSVSIELYAKLELNVDLEATFTNPYDYEEITVSAFITKPDGNRDTIDGFYTESLVINEHTGTPQNIGPGKFKIRYAPYLAGTHRMTLHVKDVNGMDQSDEILFEAIPGNNKGFVITNHTAYLQYENGDQYIPIGENMCWQNNNVYFDYTIWIDALVASGGNFLRLWHAHWGLGIEWISGWNNHLGLKKYNQVACAYQDWLFDYCSEKGVSFMLALQHHGQVSTVVNPNWSDNPYNNARGGPCVNTWDFFRNEEAKSLTKNRLRYIIARWGYSSSIMCWELFNEVEWTDNFNLYEEDIIDWHLEMAEYIKSKDVYGHLISTSFANDVGGDRLWQNNLMDLTQIHFYGNTGNIHQALAGGAQKMAEKYQKPVLIGEFGLGSGDLTNSIDPDGIHFHNGLWAALFGGTIGTGMSWWWDSYIHPRNLYHHFTPLNKIVKKVDFVEMDLRPAPSGFEGATSDLTLQPTLNWGQIADDSISIIDGIITPSNPNLSLFLYGSQFNTQFRSPPVFSVEYPKNGDFTVRTGNSGATSPRIHITVDGHILLDEPATANKDFTVQISAGYHEIKVDNSGIDWINISAYIFDDIGTLGEAYALVSSNRDYGAGWILNREYNHANISSGGIPTNVTDGRLMIKDVENLEFKFTWIDPLSGDILGEAFVTAGLNEINIPLPTFMWDLAFIFEPSNATSTEEKIIKELFNIYPNPIKAGGLLYIDVQQSSHLRGYRIFNAEGKCLQTGTLENNMINISDSYLPGIYWLQLASDRQVSSAPFIIVK